MINKLAEQSRHKYCDLDKVRMCLVYQKYTILVNLSDSSIESQKVRGKMTLDVILFYSYVG